MNSAGKVCGSESLDDLLNIADEVHNVRTRLKETVDPVLSCQWGLRRLLDRWVDQLDNGTLDKDQLSQLVAESAALADFALAHKGRADDFFTKARALQNTFKLTREKINE